MPQSPNAVHKRLQVTTVFDSMDVNYSSNLTHAFRDAPYVLVALKGMWRVRVTLQSRSLS